MKIQSLKLVCFSPTRTTKSIVHAVAGAIGLSDVEIIDITRPNGRESELRTSGKDLLIVGVPVYGGRVPVIAVEWLKSICADKTPAVCIVVYGNRDYEDALLELRDIVKECGGIPIAGAAFIAEHSFSSADIPIAAGRPDTSDMNDAEVFGRKLYEKLQSIPSVDQVSDMTFPGNYPYRELGVLNSIDFIAVSDACVQCGICAEVCPVGAIDSENSSLIDTEKCILCCACIKACPQNARKMKTGALKDVTLRLCEMCKERKEPEFII